MRRVLPVAVVALAAAGCGNPAGGDPGNKRFDELRSDGVFAEAAPGATGTSITARRAYVATTGLGRKNWEAPTVTVRFTSDAPAATVFSFYARRASAAGWSRHTHGVWSKTYPDGAKGDLLLVDLRNGRWALDGGISIPGS